MTVTAGLLLLVLFIVFLVTSLPVSIAMVLASFITLAVVIAPDQALFIASQNIITGMDSFTLLAVPFFLLSGILMSRSSIAGRLVDFALVLTGRVPGALALTNVLGNTMFGSISGSGIAAAAAIGGVMTPLEKEAGYESSFSAAVNVASAPVGQLIPPTASFIVFSLASGGASVAALFMAGWIPGLLWACSCMVVAYFYAKKHNYPVSQTQVTLALIAKTAYQALPGLAMILVIMGGIIGGIFTPTEAAGVSVLYTLIFTLLIDRSLKLSNLPSIFLETVMLTSVIMFIIGSSSVMSFLMSFTGIPTAISTALVSLSNNPVILLLLMNIFLLLIGTVMDMAPALLIFTPIFLPMMTGLGINPVHFGVIMVMNLAVGTITPPISSVLFVGASVAGLKIEPVIPKLLPFYLAIIAVLMLVTYIPAISLWLPRMVGLLG